MVLSICRLLECHIMGERVPWTDNRGHVGGGGGGGGGDIRRERLNKIDFQAGYFM